MVRDDSKVGLGDDAIHMKVVGGVICFETIARDLKRESGDPNFAVGRKWYDDFKAYCWWDSGRGESLNHRHADKPQTMSGGRRSHGQRPTMSEPWPVYGWQPAGRATSDPMACKGSAGGADVEFEPPPTRPATRKSAA